jgi:hypothetical protein
VQCKKDPEAFEYRAITFCGPAFLSGSSNLGFCNFPTLGQKGQTLSRYPHTATLDRLNTVWVWAVPVSLAATQGITVVFSSSAYLDVSVQLVRSSCPMYSGKGYGQLRPQGSPIRKSTDLGLLGISPWLIAACNVLHRLLAPRHPPSALTNLID